MKFILLLFLSVPIFLSSSAQDFSNKGKDFWVGYGSHCQMYTGGGGGEPTNPLGGSQDMVLYFTSDVTANVTITIPATGWTRSYVVPANTVVESQAIPKTGVDDVRLRAEGKFSKKSIHITSDKAIVAYAHIYNNAVSGATLLFPTNTLGKEYYSLNYTQVSNQAYSYPYCFAIATEDSTILEITPTANTLTHTAGITFKDTLMKGDVINLLGQITGNTGVDLTGTKIKSIASATGQCKKIAVFSGSGKINIRCNNAGNSSADNFIQQVFPANAWGQKYFTVPTANMPYNFFRILVKDPTTVVKYNNVIQTGIINNYYYDIPITNSPSLIEADKPVLVAQYLTTTSTCSNNFISGNGDPEMIYLSSIEQTIDKITLNSTAHSAIRQHWINVLIKSNATNSFRIDGTTSPIAFTLHPFDPTYSYVQIPVGVGQHSLSADSGFNAIAYGYGGAESYGYNAGTNIRDLFNFVTPINPLNISNQTTACSGTPFFFSITFPFQPSSLYWDFHNFQAPNVTVSAPTHDTTYFVSGKQIWRYKLPTIYTYNAPGNYPVSITAGTSGSDGCGNQQTRDDTLFVFNPPTTDFNWTHSGCATDSVYFEDNTNYVTGTFPYKWYWDFGDGTTDNVKNLKHKYLTPGVYIIRFAMISNVGCLSDTASKQIIITTAPSAKFGISSQLCEGKSITFFDSSFAPSPGNLVKWFWNFGDGVTQNLNANSNPTHVYNSPGVYDVSLKVENNTGCQSSVFTSRIIVHPNPVVNFSLPGICLPTGLAQFFDSSTIADGSQSSFSYLWNFGDSPSGILNTSAVQNPIHNYNNTGPFTVN
ncbi:MAG: PKD domain-containing protein, partial [Chitinophagaceae bacterium]